MSGWKVKKRFRIRKLRFISWLGFKLTSNERGELARWITRNITESTAETLRKVRCGAPIEGLDEDCDEFGGRFIYLPYIPVFRKTKIFTKNGLQEVDDG